MSRRCERPGCSAAATVGYGFAAVRQLAWLSDLNEGADPHIVGALCERHAVAMQLPKGWWLDDRRTNEPTLFRNPEHKPTPADPAELADERPRRRPARRNHELVIGEQLALPPEVVPPPDETAALDPPAATDRGGETVGDGSAPTPPVTLRLVVSDPVDDAIDDDAIDDDAIADDAIADDAIADDAPQAAALAIEPGTEVDPWMPVFDQDDDLGGLLDASTPLLSRAFGRGGRRSTTRPADRG